MQNRFESKYFLPRRSFDRLTTELRHRLHEGDNDTSYRYNKNRTMYLDNYDMDAFRDNMDRIRPRFKVRVRQYAPNAGAWEDVAYVELKVKLEDGFTKKIRVRIPAALIIHVLDGKPLPCPDAMLEDMNHDIPKSQLWSRITTINSVVMKYGFKYRITVEYDRRAFSSSEMRVTLDDNITYRGMERPNEDTLRAIKDSEGWKEMERRPRKVKEKDYMVLEAKHEGEVPGWFEDLLKEVGAKPVGFSKYCAAVACSIQHGQSEGNVSRSHKVGPEFIREIEAGLGKSESLDKEDFSGGQAGMHGMIDPLGKYHHMGPEQTHNEIPDEHGFATMADSIRGGWIAVGHGGQNEHSASSRTLSEPNSPAMKTFRNMLRIHHSGEKANIHLYDDEGSIESTGTHWDVDSSHLARHGKIKIMKSEGLEKAPPMESTKELGRWVRQGGDPDMRGAAHEDAIANLSDPERARMFQHMTNLTEHRKNPRTGEREFLLHRGASKEHLPVSAGRVEHYDTSSWSTSKGVAHAFATGYSNPHVVSAWVPESNVSIHVPHVMDEHGKRLSANRRMENEVIVGGGGHFDVHSVEAAQPAKSSSVPGLGVVQKCEPLVKAKEDLKVDPSRRHELRMERARFSVDPMAGRITTQAGVSPAGIEARRGDSRVRGVVSHGYARTMTPEQHMSRAKQMMRPLGNKLMKEEKKICIPKDEMVEEHKHLVDVLAHPTKERLEAERKKQARELAEYMEKDEVLCKPYRSEAQRRWAHTEAGKRALGGEKGVRHWDEATRGKNLPERASKCEPLGKRGDLAPERGTLAYKSKR